MRSRVLAMLGLVVVGCGATTPTAVTPRAVEKVMRGVALNNASNDDSVQTIACKTADACEIRYQSSMPHFETAGETEQQYDVDQTAEVFDSAFRAGTRLSSLDVVFHDSQNGAE
jgi:hypothetical protein